MKAIAKHRTFKIAFLALAMLGLGLYLWGPGLSPVFAWQLHGRMTGGGSVCKPSGCVDTLDSAGRITHGFELHCAPEDTPNRLEVNDHIGDHRFHLEFLDDVVCFNDPAIGDSKPPVAGFNTYIGRGGGRYDGQTGFCALWKFTDTGEPGGDGDTMSIIITDQPSPDGDGDNGDAGTCPGNVILNIPSTLLTFGNHQAHKN